MAGRKKTHVASGNRQRSRSPGANRSKQPSSKPSTRGGKQQQQANPPPAHAADPDQDETAAAAAKNAQQHTKHRQKLLGTFQGTFDAVITSGTFNAILQEVKSALFKRDFALAFGSEQFLEAYAARWSPTRALCYASALDSISTHLEALCPHADAKDHDDDDDQLPGDDVATTPLQVLAIGGAAAELVAVASYLSRQPTAVVGDITLVDVAPWGGVVEKLRVGLQTPPPLSKYASHAMHAANTPVNEAGRLRGVVFQERDVLALDRVGVAALVPGAGDARQPVLATLLFTLNELFTGGGIGKTTTFLLNLTSGLPTSSLLLVIDSPGSYSETTLGKEAKRYPMAWLLDKILLGAASDEDEDSDERWEKVESRDSVWFRLGNELRYPIPLEDMRYQMHLYRKGPGGAGEHDDEGEE